MKKITNKYDVVIVGGGPAGSTCALRLINSGLKVVLLEKAVFPRNKVCGDAIPERAISVLKMVSPTLLNDFRKYSNKTFISKTKFVLNDQAGFEINWKDEAYTCKREFFDQFLLESVKKETNIDIIQDFNVTTIHRHNSSIIIGNEQKDICFETNILIGCDGASSIISRRLANNKINYLDHAAAVRGYFKNVKDLIMDTTEVYTLKRFLPGYFWIFPISKDIANVGFGMLSADISNKKVNIRKVFFDFIYSSSVISEKFKDSCLIGKLEGSGLPLGSRRIKIVGNNFLLCGDAASLVDPVSGDGIGNAMLSGKLAAEQIIRSFKANNFSESFLKNYEDNLFKILGRDLKKKTIILRLGSKMPYLLNVASTILRIKIFNKFFRKVLF